MKKNRISTEQAFFRVSVPYCVVLDKKRFKMCWYTCHLRLPTFMDLNEHLFMLISSTTTKSPMWHGMAWMVQ
jgi:hypothetical protein